MKLLSNHFLSPVAAVALLWFSGAVAFAQTTAARSGAAAVSLTSPDEAISGNPIKLSISTTALTSNLPSINGALMLSQALDLAMKNNFALQSSLENVSVSKFHVRSALAKFGPSSSFSTYFAASSISQMLFLPGSQIAAQPMQPITKGESLHLLFTLYQPIFTGGRLTGEYQAARALQHESLANYRADRVATALKVKTAYWESAWNQARVRLATDYVKFREWSKANMLSRYAEGKVARAEVMREQSALAEAKQALNDAYRDYNGSLLKLKALAAVNLTSLIEPAEQLQFTPCQHDLNYYLEQAARNKPELIAAREKVKEMRARRLSQLSQYMPQLGLWGLGSNATGRTPDIDHRVNGHWGGFVGIVGGITLFDSGSRLNDVRAANGQLRSANLAAREVELKAAQDVATAWINMDLAAKNVELADEEVASAEEDKRATHARYELGKAVALDDFLAAVKEFEARERQLEVIYKYRVAEADLLAASGSE